MRTLLSFHLQDWQVCQVSVGVLGDICRAIEEGMAPYCDRVMAVLLANLQVRSRCWLRRPSTRCLKQGCRCHGMPSHSGDLLQAAKLCSVHPHSFQSQTWST